MPAFLILGTPPVVGGNFRIPSGTPAQTIRDQLRHAVESGSILDVVYEMGDNPLDRQVVTVNGKALQFFSVVETADPPPGA